MDDMPLAFERFDADKHDPRKLRTGNPKIDSWLRSAARHAQRDHTSVTHVIVEDTAQSGSQATKKKRIWGYMSLAATSIDVTSLPAEDQETLPKHPIPAVLLTRLGVDQELQGKGIGAALVHFAAQESLIVAEHIAAYCLVVDAIDAAARAFYRHLGFHPLPSQPTRLFMQLERLRKHLPG